MGNDAEEAKQVEITDKLISFDVVFQKEKFHFDVPETTTISYIKERLLEYTGVPCENQKLICSATLDDGTMHISAVKLSSKNPRIMMMGTKPVVVEQVAKAQANSDDHSSTGSTENDVSGRWCEMKQHRDVIEQNGVPENATIGIMNSEDLLPPNETLSGLIDKRGNKLRLTMKCDVMELWLSTPSSTNKIPFNVIKSIDSQPIDQHHGYSILCFQLGPTTKSCCYVYFVPTQYVQSIKDIINQTRMASIAGDHSG